MNKGTVVAMPDRNPMKEKLQEVALILNDIDSKFCDATEKMVDIKNSSPEHQSIYYMIETAQNDLNHAQAMLYDLRVKVGYVR